MNRTGLYDLHVKLGAKMVPFSGWEMPLSYSGVTDEHQTVRKGVGLFDISHMGRFELSGKGAEAYLERITPGPVSKIHRGGAQYSMLLNEEGTILDDIYLYKRGVDRFFIIVNAANREKDFRWMTAHLPKGGETLLKDVSPETALLALQGPKSWEVLVQIIPFGKTEIPLRNFIETELVPARGAKALIARTGYTGEKGYELVIPADAAEKVWNALLEAGKTEGIKPIGLGARDTLRLEMAYPLYGHDMDETTTPLDADLERFIDLEKEFIGKERLVRQKGEGVRKKLIGFELLVGGVPREGHAIYSDQKEIGKVTSGNFSPSLRKGIGMGYVDRRYAEEGSEVLVDIRGKAAAALIVKKPFYKKKK
ncbi:MAG TPA: glycine cleavage system aminomethyltransferase GcvT [Candidatus Manganitrophaceae bacterium]|nr:glycine cleavage system aminomethyltransferase GcvT [Candidatus Manganitrophaceae bacterium]